MAEGIDYDEVDPTDAHAVADFERSQTDVIYQERQKLQSAQLSRTEQAELDSVPDVDFKSQRGATAAYFRAQRAQR